MTYPLTIKEREPNSSNIYRRFYIVRVRQTLCWHQKVMKSKDQQYLMRFFTANLPFKILTGIYFIIKVHGA